MLSYIPQNNLQRYNGCIWRPSDSGIVASDTGSFIQWVDSREPMIHKMVWHGIDRICCEFHPTSRIEIPAGTVGEFFTEYLSENGQRNWIFGVLSINGSVQLIRISDIWGSGLSYVSNTRAPEVTSGLGINGSANSTGSWSASYINHINPGSSIINGGWDGGPTNFIIKWGHSVNASIDDSPLSPIYLLVVWRHVHDDFLQHIPRNHMCWQYRCTNPWFCWRIQNKNSFLSNPDRLSTQ